MAEQPRLFLVDGHALAYRTYYALTRGGDTSRWITNSGEPTAGTYGFTSVILRLLETEQPEYLAVSFDTGRTFRDDLFPDYKGTREKMPDDLRLQISRIRELIDAFGIPILEAEGFEADDVLGTVARQAKQAGVQVIILTGDRDLLQLAEEDVTIRLSGQRLSEAEDYGPAEVEARYALPPSKLVDLKALMGDSSDNIPGVRGIGEKTATKLLQEYDDLEAIYQHTDEIGSRFRTKLEQGKEDAFLSRQLGEIVRNVPIEFDLESCRAAGYDRDRIAELFRQLEFRSLLNRLEVKPDEGDDQQLSLFVSSEPAKAVELETEIVDSIGKLEELVSELSQAKVIAYDTETTDTDPIKAELVGISLAIETGRGYYLPIAHRNSSGETQQLPLDDIIDALRPAMTNLDIPKIGHNLKYDWILLARHGIQARPLGFDSMLAEWLCNPASRNLGLKNMAWVRLGMEMTQIEDLIGRGAKQISMAEVSIAQAAPYAAADAEVCLQLMPLLMQDLAEKEQTKLFKEIEMPLIPILADMEMTGIAIDRDFLASLSAQLDQRLKEIETEIYSLVGHPFNINSTQQLSTVLFEELALTPPDRARKTASGHYSTAASVLEDLRLAHPIVEMILEQREIAKLRSTYTDALVEQINPETNRIHTSFSQTGSVTGRLASSNPNLQNIPIRTELGREIRRSFVSEPEQILLSVDYSQIELRIVAHLSDDEAMIQAFNEDQDIHATTAAAIFGVKTEQVTPEMRRHAKAINFGLIYGMSPFGLTRTTELTLAEAEDFVKLYFEQFPGVHHYLQEVREIAAQRGYVETLLGRRRYFPELMQGAQSVPANVRQRAEREAINAPIQGSAADIIKIAMLRLPSELTSNGNMARLLLQVHDELLLECSQRLLAETAEIVQSVMQDAYNLCVPLKTDAKAGINWAEMQSL